MYQTATLDTALYVIVLVNIRIRAAGSNMADKIANTTRMTLTIE